MAQDELTLSAAYRAISVTFRTLVGKAPAMRRLIADAEAVAGSSVSVLLLGETGTGKNLIAQALHNASPRASGPFVSLNCSAIPESLIEPELFGSEEGAYTDARKQRRGRFELAHGGTLLLDEIGDLAPAAQAKILHALDYKEFTRVGGEATLTADVRIVAATNAPLEERVERGEFRRDLFYRLNEVTLRVPPLRERREDIPALAERFIADANETSGKRVKKIDKATLALLARHDWPGNVRELRSVVRRGVARASGGVLTMDDLQLSMKLVPDDKAAVKPNGPADLSLASAERRHIAAVLDYTGWVKSEAARLLDIARPTLDRKIEAYGLRRIEDGELPRGTRDES